MSRCDTDVPTNREEVVTTLNDLAAACFDSAKAFEQASRYLNSEGLKVFFRGAVRQREKSVRELLTIASRYGNTPGAAGTLTGTAHRGWIGLKAVLSGGNEYAILSACLAEERWTDTAYREALDKPLPRDVTVLVQRQFEGVVDVHETLVQLKNNAEAQQKARKDQSR